VSGTVYATTVSTPSDRRLKANVQPLEQRARQIFALNGVSFNYKRRPDGAVAQDGAVDTNRTHFGFIAQEVEGPFPELVGVSAGNGLRSVQYGAFVPLLVEGLKGLKEEGDGTRRNLDALSRRLDLMDQGSRSGVASQSRRGNSGARIISVKGLTATGAVTAHHDLATTTMSGDGRGDFAEVGGAGVSNVAASGEVRAPCAGGEEVLGLRLAVDELRAEVQGQLKLLLEERALRQEMAADLAELRALMKLAATAEYGD
jgi:hypothetical protein